MYMYNLTINKMYLLITGGGAAMTWREIILPQTLQYNTMNLFDA